MSCRVQELCPMDGGDIHLLLSILTDGEEQARQLGEPAAAADDEYHGGGRGEEYYRGVARQLQGTLARAMGIARAIEAAAFAGGGGGGGASGSRGTTGDRSDSPRSADESSGRTARDAAVAQQERHHDTIKRRCVCVFKFV